MNAIVIYNQHSEITAISMALDLKSAGKNIVGASVLAGDGKHVLDVELTGEFANLTLQEIHKNYRVDHGARQLVKKTA